MNKQQLQPVRMMRARATPTLDQNADSVSIERGSPPRASLFKQHRETLEKMLSRKLRSKYIDGNPVFSHVGTDDASTSLSTIKQKRNPSQMAYRFHQSIGEGIGV